MNVLVSFFYISVYTLVFRGKHQKISGFSVRLFSKYNGNIVYVSHFFIREFKQSTSWQSQSGVRSPQQNTLCSSLLWLMIQEIFPKDYDVGLLSSFLWVESWR